MPHRLKLVFMWVRSSWSKFNLKMLVFQEGGKLENQEKTLGQGEKQQLNFNPHMAPGRNWTRVTLVTGERSHHCAIQDRLKPNFRLNLLNFQILPDLRNSIAVSVSNDFILIIVSKHYRVERYNYFQCSSNLRIGRLGLKCSLVISMSIKSVNKKNDI